jgi:hypothetical protein
MQKKQSNQEEVDRTGIAGTLKRTRRVAMTWNQELKDSALPDLKAHVDAINGEGVSSKQLFFLCMGMGLQRDFMGEVPPRKSDSVRLEYLDEKDFALLKTVALAYKKDFSILLDEDAAYDIAEQFASGGLQIFADEMKSQLNFPVWLISHLSGNLEEFLRQN